MRGFEQCWQVFDGDLSKCMAVTELILAGGFYGIRTADYCGDNGDGFSSEFIIDSTDVDGLKAIYKQYKARATR